MTKLKLTYFDGPGRAEAIRLCFVVGGVEFEDERVNKEQWGAMKTAALENEKRNICQMPFLPWLEVDGVVISQSLAILRYAAATAGLDGKAPLEKAKIDMVLSTFQELLEITVKYVLAEESDKEQVLEKAKEVWKKMLTKLESMMKESNGGGKWLIGNDMSAADIVIFSFLKQTDARLSSMVSKSIYDDLDIPCLKGLAERVGQVEKIKEYYDKQAEQSTKS
ncbi:glutathione S-transferase 3-like [Saccoglossus kowalevskii]|uniref:glutathione transferase n=1 Tax=Saccoglossus kowalevskii TaxID=10224 RepID=A0ABM0GNL3_SACKO|nr:PREDICTED: glutathione S-transferase 1-like [Saccoglossus kowalevskii]